MSRERSGPYRARMASTVLEQEIRTAGKPAAILLSPDRDKIKADGSDLSFVERDDRRCGREPRAPMPPKQPDPVLYQWRGRRDRHR